VRGVRPVTGGASERWLAAVWVRDLDGRRRLVEARLPGRAVRPRRRWGSDWPRGAPWAFVEPSRT
jgi:hypothetical protein